VARQPIESSRDLVVNEAVASRKRRSSPRALDDFQGVVADLDVARFFAAGNAALVDDVDRDRRKAAHDADDPQDQVVLGRLGLFDELHLEANRLLRRGRPRRTVGCTRPASLTL